MAEELEAGRALDALIAERVFGLTVARDWPTTTIGGETFCYDPDLPREYVVDDGDYPDRDCVVATTAPHCIVREPVPCYSTQIAAAWTVVEKLKSLAKVGNVPCDLCVKVGLGHYGPFCEIFDLSPMGYVGYDGPLISASADGDTAPLAICRAALAAVASTTTEEQTS